MNVLSSAIAVQLSEAAAELAADPAVRAVVIYGGPRAFAAGADVKEFESMRQTQLLRHGLLLERAFAQIAALPKPVIAAVAGFALGGGCEVAMMCDIIIAAETAKFGQPEITLGIIPGAGGTQRLTRALGKAKAMDLVLTGRMMDAGEAESVRVALFDPAAEKFRVFSLPTKNEGIRKMIVDAKGKLWYMGSHSGKLGVVE